MSQERSGPGSGDRGQGSESFDVKKSEEQTNTTKKTEETITTDADGKVIPNKEGSA